MIGKYHIEISGADLIKGMSTSADIADGGFSPETDGVNLTYNPGILYAAAAPVDKSTNLTDNMIAACEDPTYLGKDQMYLDDTGSFYSWNGTALTKEATTSGDLFTEGTTDMVAWYDTSTASRNFYATTKAGSSGDIVKWNGTSGLVETWWSGAGTLNQGALSATTPWRPLLVYETNLYVGDKNKLHRIDPALTVSNGILTLSATESISALGIDKSSGKMLVATSLSADYSASRNSKSRIYIYDGSGSKADRVIPINGTVTSFKNIDDRTIVFVGNKVGHFTGSGIKFLRKMDFALGDATKLIYPHRATVIENTLYFAENTKVIGFGEIREKGDKVFYPVVANNVNSNVYKCLSYIGAGKLGLGFASSKFYTFDTTSVSTTNTLTFYTNKINFPKPVILIGAYVEYATAIASNDDNRSLYYRSEDLQSGFQILRVQGTETGGGLKNTSSSSVNFIDDVIGFVNNKVRSVQFRYITSTSNSGLKRIIVYYNPAE